jgi:ABC-2 type transport system ATP-binding protein
VEFLSLGMKRRVELDIMTGLSLDTFLMDEPFNALDADARKDLAVVLERLKKSGATLVISSHENHDFKTPPDQVVEFK